LQASAYTHAAENRVTGDFTSRRESSVSTKRTPPVRFIFAAILFSACIGCDQATKCIATSTLRDALPQSFLGDTVRLQYALNPGGFLSLGSNMPDGLRRWLFVGFNSCAMLALSVYLLVKRDLPLPFFLSVALILAGGIGNLIDRVCNNGFVTDFLNLGIGPVRTGVFNVADMAVTFGVLTICYASIRRNAREQTHPPESL
jgi:signal peptidase II